VRRSSVPKRMGQHFDPAGRAFFSCCRLTILSPSHRDIICVSDVILYAQPLQIVMSHYER
jgi:hypothetical protein